MKKRIIALILVIPLILMFTVFNLGKTVSILVPISVSGIKLDYETQGDVETDGDILSIDMSNKQAQIKLKTEIMPIDAANKEYVYTYSAVEDAQLGAVTIAQGQDGDLVTLTKPGKVKITVTSIDGSFTDSITLDISSTKPNEFNFFSQDHTITTDNPDNSIPSVTMLISDTNFSLFTSTDSTVGSDDDYSALIEWEWWKEDSSSVSGISFRLLSSGGRWISINDETEPCPYVKATGVVGEFEIIKSGDFKLRAVLNGQYTSSGEDIVREIEVKIQNPTEPYRIYGAGVTSPQEGEANYSLDSFTNQTGFSMYIDEVAFERFYSCTPQSVTDWVALLNLTVDATANVSVTYNSNDKILSFIINPVSPVTVQSGALTFNVDYKYLDESISFDVCIMAQATADNFVWKRGSAVLSDGTLYLPASGGSPTVLSVSASSALKGIEFTYSFVGEGTSAQVNGVDIASPNVKLTYSSAGSVTVKATITLSAYVDGEIVTYNVQKEITVEYIHASSSLSIVGGNETYGFGKIFTIGDSAIKDWALTAEQYTVRLSTVGYNSNDTIQWTSSNTEIATVNSSGAVTVVSSGIVTITARSVNSQTLGKEVKTSMQLKCVKNGINVYGYDDLLCCSLTDKIIVLRCTIGSALDMQKDETAVEFGTTSKASNFRSFVTSCGRDGSIIEQLMWYKYDKVNTDLKVAYTQRAATSDTKFNTNLGKGRLTIAVGMIINNDLHGNGYTLNAKNLTTKQTNIEGAQDFDIFNGPVVFVSVEALGYFTYGQDNIAFLIEKDNVTVDNCIIQSTDPVTDLSKLEYVGTAVEVMGENDVISNCRLMWGRTVLRVFSGNANDPIDDSSASLTVKRCVIAHSREFNMRIGANKTLKTFPNLPIQYTDSQTGQTITNNYGPSLQKQDSTPESLSYYTSPNDRKLSNSATLVKQNNDALLADQYFVDTYVRTRVTLEDCVFTDSGIFSIAMESHFAGMYLDGYGHSGAGQGKGWRECAGTSYASVLTLKGQVRFYDWKDVNTINTNSMLGLSYEMPDPFGLTNILIRYDQKNPSLNLLRYQTESDGKEHIYAHAAIAFYGGGKNYSLIQNLCEDNIYCLPTSPAVAGLVDIVQDVKGDMIREHIIWAAGDDNFVTYCNRETDAFSPDVQKEEIERGTAISWLTAE